MLSSSLLLLALWPPSAAGARDRVASVVLEPQGQGRDIVVTFAHPFRKGDIKEGMRLLSGGREIAAQVEEKRRYPDGSVKHAIVSVPLKRAAPGQKTKLDILRGRGKEPSGAPVKGLPEGFQAEVVFRFPDGTERRADAGEFHRRASSGRRPWRLARWLEGPLVAEYQLSGPPSGAKGDPDPDLLVTFGLRVFERGKAVRVEVVVENPWVDAPGNIPYDVKVRLGGEEVFSKDTVGHWEHRLPYWLRGKDRNLGHFVHARWRKVFWWGTRPPEVHVRYDVPYLVSTGLLPRYDATVRVSPRSLERVRARWQKSPRGILENGFICAYFPTTGGRDDIGPYPGWTTRYTLSQDGKARLVCLGTGDLAGSFPVHVRDRNSRRLFSLDEHPGYSLNRRGTFERIPPRKAPDRPYVLPATSPYEVDCAHQPSLAFVPYLVTGECYYLEEMYFWANWCMLKQNAGYRQRGKGLITPDQVRGQAWALRQIVDAAKIAPDDHPEKRYFEDKVGTNLAYYNRFISGPEATPLGAYTVRASDAYVRGRAPEERYKWLTLAPWQQNFLAWSLDHAVMAGYLEAAKPRDYFLKLQIGMLTNPNEFKPEYAAPYFLVVGERADRKAPARYYTAWKELFDKTFVVVAPPKPGKEPKLTTGYGGHYPFISRGVLLIAAREKLEKADDALRLLESHLPNRAQVLSEDPTWAFGR